MIKTVIVQIGNTDNKLTQTEWSQFVKEIYMVFNRLTDQTHFAGGPSTDSQWQNYCVVGTMIGPNIIELMHDLMNLRNKYRQESIALTVGDTEFIGLHSNNKKSYAPSPPPDPPKPPPPRG